ncbi:DMT family transporter [Dickeya lacustris]|uniref:DMT family transporter n=1 Tax=Dickeya lacustris TaxID=2259638 RepID=A0ABY8G3M8_9GAMM|nr:DMT family transporter [Dickeya lacustris]WFN54543.1 DMT family transporter [Dickeya lacustris]
MKINNPGLLPILALIVSTIGITSAGVFVIFSEVDATATLMLRMFLAGGITSAIVTWSAEKGNITEGPNHNAGKGKMIALLVLSGIISTIDLLSNHWALKMTSLANAAILMNLSPVFVALLSFLFMKEKIGTFKLFALTLTIAGACLLVFDGNASIAMTPKSMAGDLLAINSALFYAIYLIFTKSLRDYFTSKKIIIWNSFTCAILLLPLALATSQTILPSSPTGWAIIILLALISQLLGHGLMAYALKHVDILLASISTLARPVIAILFGFFIFDEKLAPLQWLGVVTVLIGIWWYKRPTTESRVVAQAKA